MIYTGEGERMGYLPNYTPIFSLHPEAFRAWRSLASALIGGKGELRYELATLGAARQLRSSYCSLAHGKILRDKFHDADQIRRIAEDPASSGLDEVDQAIIEFAGKVAADATSIAAMDTIASAPWDWTMRTSSMWYSPPPPVASSPKSSTPPGPSPIEPFGSWSPS